MKRRSYWYILILSLCAALAACSGNSHDRKGTTAVTISIGSGSGTAGAKAPGISRALPIVASLSFTITAADITTAITRTVAVSPPVAIVESFDVPNGDNRLFVVEARSSTGTVIYQGSTVTNLNGTAKALTVVMQAMFFNELFWTMDYEEGTAIAKDSSGNIIIAGHTYGNLDGNKNVGPDPAAPSTKAPDVFVSKVSSTGSWLWTRQLGGAGFDLSYGVAVDPGDDSIVVVGSTVSGRNGNPNKGGVDCFVTKLSATGSGRWTTVLGSVGDDYGEAIAVGPAGNVYVTGYTDGHLDTGATGTIQFTNIFVSKISSTGLTIWKDQTSATGGDSFGEGIAVDLNGNVFVTGYTNGSLAGYTNADPSGSTSDAFLLKYDTNKTRLGSIQYGTPDYDDAWAVAVDALGQSVYVTGGTWGSLDGILNTDPTATYNSDIFLTKVLTTPTGTTPPVMVIQWNRQLGTPVNDIAQGITVDNVSGNIFITGYTDGNLDGNTTSGFSDVFVAKYDTNGNRSWTQQMGSKFYDDGRGIIVDSAGDLWVAGSTNGGFTVPSISQYDAFIMRFDGAYAVP